MKRSLMRPSAALFPLALLGAVLVTDGSIPFAICIFYFGLQLISLCAVDAFRNAAAREPGIRRVDRRLSGGLVQLLLGATIAAALLWHITRGDLNHVRSVFYLLGIALCILIEQMFEERVSALGKTMDVLLMSGISSVLLFAGMVLDDSWNMWTRSPQILPFTLGCTAVAMVLSLVVSLVLEPLNGFSFAPRNLGFAPKAMVQTLLYPAAALGLLLETGHSPVEVSPVALAFGLMLWRLSRTVCRRSHDESRPLNLLLVSVTAAAMIASVWATMFEGFALSALLSLICAVAVFCAPGWRLYTGAALLIAAEALHFFEILGTGIRIPAIIVCCIAAVILNLHKAFLKKV